MRPILLCQLERCPSSNPYSLDGIVGGHVLNSKDVFLLKPLLSMLSSPILPLSFPVLHGASPLKTDSSRDAGNRRFRLTSAKASITIFYLLTLLLHVLYRIIVCEVNFSSLTLTITIQRISQYEKTICRPSRIHRNWRRGRDDLSCRAFSRIYIRSLQWSTDDKTFIHGIHSPKSRDR